MKKYALLTLIAIMAVSVFAATYTVDGYAFLKGQSDHSGIKVFFQRVAPDTNYSYTIYSSSTGYYSQVVENGWYNITYSKSSFISQDTTDVALYSNKTLNNVTLQKQGLSGSISGVLTSGVYYVTDSLFIPEGDSLIIEPGVTLNFNFGTALIANGVLKAEGNETDSIYFNATNDNWEGITLNSYSDGSSIKFCHFEKTRKSAILIYIAHEITFEYNGNITDTFIDTIDTGVQIEDYSYNGGKSANIFLRNMYIKGNGNGSGIYSTGPIILSLAVETCSITNFWAGIFSEMHYEFISSYVINNSVIQTEFGIYTSETDVTVYNSTFVVQDTGICDDPYVYPHNDLKIYNCLINFRTGLDFYVWNRGICAFNPIVQNNNVYGFETNYACGPYIGTNVTTNANGDPCDAYGNISMYPYFADINNRNFRLLSNSPCIDAGTNNIAGFEFPQTDLDDNYRIWDGDCNSTEIVDMGAYEYGSQEVINSPSNVNISVIANTLTITWDLMTGANSYLIYHSNDPYGTFELVGNVGTNTWYSTIDTNTKKFYQIVASSDPVK